MRDPHGFDARERALLIKPEGFVAPPFVEPYVPVRLRTMRDDPNAKALDRAILKCGGKLNPLKTG